MRTGKLTLPNVTLIAVDAHTPERTIRSMWQAMRLVNFAEVVLVTNAKPIPIRDLRGVRTVVAAGDSSLRTWREQIMIMRLHKFFSTTHCLNMEWDSCVGNPAAWREEWLTYDFIGAPWPWPYTEPGCVTPCTAENCVGNTGFSLISRTLSKAAELVGQPNLLQLTTSDAYLCRTLRPALEAFGIRFAPEAVGEAFSCENRIYAGQFGWHGQSTIEMNGWNWRPLPNL